MKRIGLFIGIDRYKNGINTLNCAVNDATSLMTAFARAQYDTVEALFNDDAHSEKIIEKIETITRELKEGDIFVFYFSGHGREIEGTHYLVGPTARANKAFYSIGSVSLPQLIDLTNIPGLNRLFILDCCRSNILADKAGDYCCDQARDIAINAAIRQHENKAILPPLILSSCSTGERAFEDSETKHGFFTNALLGSIQDPSVRSFLSFQKSLKITGSPEAQNICWTGDPFRWNEIPLFASWKAQSDDNDQLNESLCQQKLFEKEGNDIYTRYLEGNIPCEAERGQKLRKAEKIVENFQGCYENTTGEKTEDTPAKKTKNLNITYGGMMLISWISYGGALLFEGPAGVIFRFFQIWIITGTIIEFFETQKTKFETFPEGLFYKVILPVCTMLPAIRFYKRHFEPWEARFFLLVSLGIVSMILFGLLVSFIVRKKKSGKNQQS